MTFTIELVIDNPSPEITLNQFKSTTLAAPVLAAAGTCRIRYAARKATTLNLMLRIYHNPRCSKSRAALTLLEDADQQPEILKYLENPPSEERLRGMLKKLDISAVGLLRTGENEYKTLGLDRGELDVEDAVEALLTQPKLMQRPIIETDDRAFVARSPERVKEIL